MNGLSVNVSRQIDYLSKSNTALSRKCQIWLPKQVLSVDCHWEFHRPTGRATGHTHYPPTDC